MPWEILTGFEYNPRIEFKSLSLQGWIDSVVPILRLIDSISGGISWCLMRRAEDNLGIVFGHREYRFHI